MTFKKEGKKKQSRKKRRGKASGSGAEAWTTLPSADYCHSWGNLWVWGEPVGILSFFNKAWIELAHSLSLAWEMLHHKQRADNWSHACGYYHTCTFLFWIFLPRIVWDFLFAVTSRQSFTHAHPHTAQHSSRAGPDCCGWRYVVESSITRASLWSNQVCPGVSGVQCQLSKDRPSLAGGREGHAGAFHDIRRHINPAADGWMDGRWLGRGCGFAKAHRDASSTGDGFLPSSVHPTAKWETAGGMEGALFKPHLFSANSSSEGRLASCLNILDGRVMAPDDISDLGQLWEWRKTPPAQSWKAESCTWTLKYSY